MNSPTIDSTPGTCGLRPETTEPNTTSRRPVARPSTTPHAASSSVFTVTPNSRARTPSPPDNPADASTTTRRGNRGTRAASTPTNRVAPSSPASSRRHAPRAARTS
ncbi:hypothetical protein GCM10010424_74580 [Streptomyces lienomycini]